MANKGERVAIQLMMTIVADPSTSYFVYVFPTISIF